MFGVGQYVVDLPTRRVWSVDPHFVLCGETTRRLILDVRRKTNLVEVGRGFSNFVSRKHFDAQVVDCSGLALALNEYEFQGGLSIAKFA
jgi:hypothetical protein